jgi:hypothetical protein
MNVIYCNDKDEGTDSALQSMQMKHNQLQKASTDIGSHHRAFCIKKAAWSCQSRSHPIGSKPFLSEKETIHSTLRQGNTIASLGAMKCCTVQLKLRFG